MIVFCGREHIVKYVTVSVVWTWVCPSHLWQFVPLISFRIRTPLWLEGQRLSLSFPPGLIGLESSPKALETGLGKNRCASERLFVQVGNHGMRAPKALFFLHPPSALNSELFLKVKDQLTVRLLIWIIDPKTRFVNSWHGKGKEERIGKGNGNKKVVEACPAPFLLAVTNTTGRMVSKEKKFTLAHDLMILESGKPRSMAAASWLPLRESHVMS